MAIRDHVTVLPIHPIMAHPSIQLPDEAATARLGQQLAELLTPGDTMLIRGDLGAGKTTLARSLIRGLLDDPNHIVPSPTYTLMQSYPWRHHQIVHVDLYRIEDSAECQELGLEEIFGTDLVLVEWPERLGPYEPEKFIALELQHPDSGTQGRVARVTGKGHDDLVGQIVESWNSTDPTAGTS